MITTQTTLLTCSPSCIWQDVQTSRLLTYVTAPLVRFTPVNAPTLPTVWAEDRYLVQVHLFGWLPFSRQWIVISKDVVDPRLGQQHYALRDNGRGAVALLRYTCCN
jgi:hypothetical protein